MNNMATNNICAGQLTDFSMSGCRNNAKFQSEGKRFCGIHDPSEQKRRAQSAGKRRHKEYDAGEEIERLKDAIWSKAYGHPDFKDLHKQLEEAGEKYRAIRRGPKLRG